MEPNPFTKQRKGLSCGVCDIIVEGPKPFKIGPQLNLPRETVSNIVDRFVCTGSVEARVQWAPLNDHKLQIKAVVMAQQTITYSCAWYHAKISSST